MTSVNVVIATFRRPDRLRDAVSSLALSASRVPRPWTVGLTIVDDDPHGTAAPVAAEFAEQFELGCAYLSCGSQNISQARNTGLESALGTADWIASIDDDVVVPPDWFEVCTQAVDGERHNAVTGPLLKDYSNGPSWLTEQPFDQLGILTGIDGEVAFTCATGNNWVRADFLRQHPSLRFSHELGTTGGEDMDFFYRAVDLGLCPVFSVRSAVTEREPAARCTLRYQLRRAFWLGISEAQISLRLHKASRARLLARGARRALNRGASQLPDAALPRRGVRYDLAVYAQCLGVLMGCLGLTMRHK